MAIVQVEVQGSANYYTALDVIQDLGVTGFSPSQQFTIHIELLDYTGTDQIDYQVSFGKPGTTWERCFHATWITPSGNPYQEVTGVFPAPPTGIEWTGTAGASGCLDFTQVEFYARPYTYPGTAFMHARATIDFTPIGLAGPYCEYGVQRIPSTPATIITDSATISAVMTVLGWPESAAVFAPILSRFVDVDQLCQTLPPSGFTVNAGLFNNSLETIFDTFKWAMWWSYCECKPGATTPAPPPTPVLVVDPRWPPARTYPCDPSVLCDALVAIQKQLTALQNTIQSDYQLTTLMQRYQLPMAVIRGATHSGLTQSGAFAISRLIGFEVVITDRPQPGRTLVGQPQYIWDAGWLSVSDNGAMLQEKRLTRDRQTWLPRECALGEVFGYYLNPGVTVDITELEAEP